MQNEMYEGLERRRDLITELRTTHALQAHEKEALVAQQQALAQEREAAAKDAQTAATAKAVISEVHTVFQFVSNSIC